MLAFLLLIPGILLLLLALQWIAELYDLRRYPMPGRLIDIGGRHIHAVDSLREQAPAQPAVLLESGLAATSLSWVFTPPLLAKFARVVSYDRAGLGRSSYASTGPVLPSLLADLDALTRTLNLPLPFVLVGHSFGGLIVQSFAHLHPKRVAGLVLLDPASLETYAHPNDHHQKRLNLAVRLSRRGALLARFGVVRAALSLVARGSRMLPSFIGRVSAGKGSPVMDRLAGEIAKLPPETHGPIRAHWSKPASFRLMAQYLHLLPDAARRAQAMPVPLHIPVIILSAASATAAELAERDDFIRGRPGSRHTQIPNTTHWIQLDRPDLVAGAVQELLSLAQPIQFGQSS